MVVCDRPERRAGKAMVLCMPNESGTSACTCYCEKSGIDILETITLPSHDPHTQAPGIVRSLLAKKNESGSDLDSIILLRASNITRDTEVLEDLVDRCQRSGVMLISVKEGVISEAQHALDSAMAWIRFCNARGEYISCCAKSRSIERRGKGIPSGRPPLGLLSTRTESRDPTFLQIPELAPKIHTLFELASTGCTIREVVIRALALGLLSASGMPLSTNNIKQILRNPVYAGLLIAEDGVTLIPGNFPGIVTTELFFKVQSILDSRARRRSFE